MRNLIAVCLFSVLAVLAFGAFATDTGPPVAVQQVAQTVPAVLTPAVARDIAEQNTFAVETISLDRRIAQIDRALKDREAAALIKRGTLSSDYLTTAELVDRYSGSDLYRLASRRSWHAGK